MMTKFECRDCLEYFDFNTAAYDNGRWVTFCPNCKTPTPIDIEDYLVDIGTIVTMVNGETGTITGYDTTKADNFDDIIYIVDRGAGKSNCHAKRCCFKIEDTWKKLRRIPGGGGIVRVCHYPRNQEYSNVPCYGCADRTKCNADIFETLAQYEDSDLKPDDVAQLKTLQTKLAAAGLTLDEALRKLS